MRDRVAAVLGALGPALADEERVRLEVDRKARGPQGQAQRVPGSKGAPGCVAQKVPCLS